MEVLLFWIFAIVGVFCGFMVVSHRSPMSSALYLVVTMLCLAGVYSLLHSAFVAILQVLIYAGAVMVLILFVIMMFSLREDALRREGSPLAWGLAAVIGLLLVIRLGALFPSPSSSQPLAADFGTMEAVGRLMFSRYLLPFELSGVLLLIAVIGAVVLAKRTTP